MDNHCNLRLLLTVLLCLPLIVADGAFAATSSSKKVFHWIDDEDYFPFIYRDEQGRPVGVWTDVMKEVFRRLKIPLSVEFYPWKRAQKYVEEGRGDGMITALTEKRKPLFVATDPIYIVSERAFARSDNPRIEQILSARSIEDLKGFRIVDVIGSGWAEEHFKDLDVTWAPSYDSALNMLASGRVDIYVLAKYQGSMDIRKRISSHAPFSDGLRKVIVGPHTLSEIRYSLLIRKNSPFVGIVPEFNRVLRELHQDGSYQAILDRHLQSTKSAQDAR